MDSLENINLESVFEEGICATCGRNGVDKFSSITSSFIKYRNQLISFAEIISKTLSFKPTNENCSMEICEQCKVKLQEFYNFRMRSEEARKISKDPATKNAFEIDRHDKEDPMVYSIFDIIRDFVKNNSISRLEADINPTRLIIHSLTDEEEEQQEPIIQINPLESDFIEIEEEICDQESSVEEEYIEDYIEHIEEVVENEDDESMLSESQEESANAEKPINPRRPRFPDQWACNKRKTLRNSGKSYINSKGKMVEERKMLASCGLTCRNKCESRMTEADREYNFQTYWMLGDVVEQRKFIDAHITSRQPTRRKVLNSSRTVTLQFHLDVRNPVNDSISLTHVCKKMFKNTLSISSQVIQGVVRKYSTTGYVDPRGRHPRKLTEAQLLARKHVQQFPYFYIDKKITKVQLYHMYSAECQKQNIEPVKESNYRDIFDKFHDNNFLKADNVLCIKCNRYYKATDEERGLLQKEHDEHLATDRKCRDRALGRIRNRRSRGKKEA